VDSTTHQVLFKAGRDLEGAGVGPVGAGLLPIISTQRTVLVDTLRTGFAAGSPTNATLHISYQNVLPINLRRPGFPDDLTVVFSNSVLDTGLAIFPVPAAPAKFKIIAHTGDGDRQLDFRFRDRSPNATTPPNGWLDRSDEFIDVVTYSSSAPTVPQVTWRLQLGSGTTNGEPLVPPSQGDEYDVYLTLPFGASDSFVFTAHAERVDLALAETQDTEPYVVPNPYVASAAFEPERFAIAGRGERRLEFRNLPQSCTIRIYNVRGELVQTLRHDGTNAGMVPWNLRTKDNLDVAPGLYIFHVDGGQLGSSVGKFAVIK